MKIWHTPDIVSLLHNKRMGTEIEYYRLKYMALFTRSLIYSTHLERMGIYHYSPPLSAIFAFLKLKR
jgi:hypothetical protein